MMTEAWRVRHGYSPWDESEINLQAKRWHVCSCGICAGHKWHGRPFADLRRAPIEEIA